MQKGWICSCAGLRTAISLFSKLIDEENTSTKYPISKRTKSSIQKETTIRKNRIIQFL